MVLIAVTCPLIDEDSGSIYIDKLIGKGRVGVVSDALMFSEK